MTERARRCKSMKRLMWKYSMFLPGHTDLTEQQKILQQWLFVVSKCCKWDKYIELGTFSIPDDL